MKDMAVYNQTGSLCLQWQQTNADKAFSTRWSLLLLYKYIINKSFNGMDVSQNNFHFCFPVFILIVHFVLPAVWARFLLWSFVGGTTCKWAACTDDQHTQASAKKTSVSQMFAKISTQLY